MNVSSSFLVIYSSNHFVPQNGVLSGMFYQHLLYLKSVHCYLPPPLVYGLYAFENVDNCEQPLNTTIICCSRMTQTNFTFDYKERVFRFF